MSRLDVNRFGEMEIFVRVVADGSLSAAARALRMTPSAVSKSISRLEARLGVRLLNRSTRGFQLTGEGRRFHARASQVLDDLDEAEREIAGDSRPGGRLCVNANVPFGHHLLLPIVPAFLDRYPEIELDVVLSDEVVDLMGKRVDVAIRAGPLRSSRLVARKLGATRMMIVAAPSYLARHGRPRRARDLERHLLIDFDYPRARKGWPLLDGARAIRILPPGRLQASDGEAVRRLALAGAGVARLAAFQVREDIASSRLVPLLERNNPGDTEEVHAVFVGQGGHLPSRVRAFLDFLVANAGLR
jgi:DNA-binding transcriptional LysR family regulator